MQPGRHTTVSAKRRSLGKRQIAGTEEGNEESVVGGVLGLDGLLHPTAAAADVRSVRRIQIDEIEHRSVGHLVFD